MTISWIWAGMVTAALLCGLFFGTLDAVAAAALSGAQSAVELSLSMAGILCLWSGVMEVLRACGLADKIAALFRPLLRRLLPNASRDTETLAAVSANVSANLLGLGNAATPLGIQAACRMARGCGDPSAQRVIRPPDSLRRQRIVKVRQQQSDFTLPQKRGRNVPVAVKKNIRRQKHEPLPLFV